MKPNLTFIREQLLKHLPFLKKDYHVEDIGVFGSVAKQTARSDSDVDILVNFSTAPGFFKFIQLEEYLSRVLNRRVDLVTKKGLKPVMKEEILHHVTYV